MVFLVIGVAVAVGLIAAYVFIVGDATYLGRRGVRATYQLAARGWTYPTDAQHQRIDRAELLPVLQRALAGVSAPRVLDVATGTGRVPLLLATAPGFHGEIDGMDLAPNMLVRARDNLAAVDVAVPVHLHEGEAGRLAFPDATFDLVTCIEAFINFPRPRRALAEMVRVLRPGGTLVMTKGSDLQARLVPGKGITRRGFERNLDRLGMDAPSFEKYSGGAWSELFVSTKPG